MILFAATSKGFVWDLPGRNLPPVIALFCPDYLLQLIFIQMHRVDWQKTIFLLGFQLGRPKSPTGVGLVRPLWIGLDQIGLDWIGRLYRDLSCPIILSVEIKMTPFDQ